MDTILKSDYRREFIAGFFAGITSQTFGHPMDTIKVINN